MDAKAKLARIEIVSDAICPWCYIGKRQLERALPMLADQGLDFDIHWHPFQLNPDMPADGIDRATYRKQKFGSEERIREIDARVKQAGAAVGLDIRHDLMLRTPNTIAAHRVVWLAGQQGVQDAVVEALFRGFFTEGADIGDPATLARIADENGLPAARVTAMLDGDEGLAIVLSEDDIARRSGINGVPSFIMQGHVLFSGAMPAETMAEAFTRAHGILSQQAA